MASTWKRSLSICAAMAALACGLGAAAQTAPAQTKPAMAPKFEVDPLWPKPLPHHWVLGSSVGVWVDKHDNIWMVHRGNNPDTIRGQEMKPPFSEPKVRTT